MDRGVIFDFDGVITNGIPFHHQAYLMVFKKIGLDIPADYLHTSLGSNPKQILRMILKDFNIQANYEELYKQHHELLFQLYKTQAQPAPGLLQFLQDLKKNSFTLCIASSNEAVILKIMLSKFGIKKYFSV